MDQAKVQAKDVIDAMPDNLSVEEIAHRLYINEKIRGGLEDFANGHYYTQAEVEQIMKSWTRPTK